MTVSALLYMAGKPDGLELIAGEKDITTSYNLCAVRYLFTPANNRFTPDPIE